MKNKGVTLIELIAVIAILSIILSAIFATSIGSEKIYQKGMNEVDAQNTARVSLMLIADSIKKADTVTSDFSKITFVGSNLNAYNKMLFINSNSENSYILSLSLGSNGNKYLTKTYVKASVPMTSIVWVEKERISSWVWQIIEWILNSLHQLSPQTIEGSVSLGSDLTYRNIVYYLYGDYYAKASDSGGTIYVKLKKTTVVNLSSNYIITNEVKVASNINNVTVTPVANLYKIQVDILTDNGIRKYFTSVSVRNYGGSNGD